MRIEAQKGQRKGMLAGQTRPFTPDWIAERYERDPGTGRKTEVPTEVHAIEATLASNWGYGKFGEHKSRQSWGTLATLAAKYPRSRITYHIVCPAEPPAETRAYIENEVIAAAKASGAQVRVVWRVVGFLSGAAALGGVA